MNSTEVLEVGQTLWVTSSYGRRSGYSVTIEKVGRKYAYAKEFRKGTKIDKETLAVRADGYGKVGQCYLSEEDYEVARELYDMWQRFRHKIYEQFKLPKDITIEKIDQASKSLGLSY